MATPIKTLKLYVKGFLPQSSGETLTLKNAVERELKRIMTAFDIVKSKIEILENYFPLDLSAYLNKVDGNQQVVTNEVRFEDNVEIGSGGDITTEVGTTVDFSASDNVFVRNMPTTGTVSGLNAVNKTYVDALDATQKVYIDNHPGLSTAWVCFNGSTGAIQASYGISTVVRNSAGDYTITFSTPMANANYAWSNGAQQPTIADGQANILASSKTTTALRVVTRRSVDLGLLPVPTDFTTVSITIHGGR